MACRCRRIRACRRAGIFAGTAWPVQRCLRRRLIFWWTVLISNAAEARRRAETNSAFAPFTVRLNDIFGDEGDARGSANQLVIGRIGIGLNHCEDSGAIGRRYGDPPVSRLETGIECQFEAKLIEVKAEAAFLIANEDVDTVKAEVRVRLLGGGRVAHRGDDRSVRRIALYGGWSHCALRSPCRA